MKNDNISGSVISRLPSYYHCVEELYQCNCVRVSSATLAQRLGYTASQIRQDFSCFGEFGLQGYGYNVKKLRYEIRDILGMNHPSTAILIGCGNLGQALLKNFNFPYGGFYMLAAFDVDVTKIGKQIGSVCIMDYKDMQKVIEEKLPDMAVLTVPQGEAAEIASTLADLGIRAIWNFTGAELHVEDKGVVVEQASLVDSLLTLGFRLNQA